MQLKFQHVSEHMKDLSSKTLLSPGILFGMTLRSRNDSNACEANSSGSKFNEEMHSSVLTFIKKLGYRQTEQIFRDEARSAGIETIAFELRAEQDSSVQPAVLLEKINAVNLKITESEISDSSKIADSVYEVMFAKLKKWAYNSLDIYRDELSQVLYPVFIHCFLDLVAKNLSGNGKKVNFNFSFYLIFLAHRFFEKFKEDFKLIHGDELMRLKSISDSVQLKENSLASTYRNNKYNLTMSAYSFQLLINFLQEHNFFVLLKILNQYINIRVLVSRPATSTLGSAKTSFDKETRPQGINGLSSTLQNQINTEPLNWGVHSIDPLNESEILRRLRNDLALNGSLKTQDQLNNAVNQMRKNLIGTSENTPKQIVLSRPQAGAAELSMAVERIKGISNRAILSSTNLPSICCYTIHNSYDCICSSEFSSDFTLMATGNRESYVEIWSLTKQRLKSLRPSTELSAMSTSDLESVEDVFESNGSWSKRLVGHSGPVYSCRFSPDNQFLFSASQDGTIRMWSLCTFSTIVIFKGHNGPVWDVDVGPSGHYFVSGSADRTARLWSTQGLQPLRLFVGHLSDVDVRFINLNFFFYFVFLISFNRLSNFIRIQIIY